MKRKWNDDVKKIKYIVEELGVVRSRILRTGRSRDLDENLEFFKNLE